MEEWRQVIGYEGIYEISSIGRVRSVDRVMRPVRGNPRKLIGNIHSQAMGTNNYHLTKLSKHGVQTPKMIHRLVAEAFLPKAPYKTQVNHKNGIKTDNRVENLEWCNRSENMIHSYKVLGRRDKRCKIDRAGVLAIREASKIFPMTEIVKYFNTHYATIYNIAKGRTYKYVV